MQRTQSPPYRAGNGRAEATCGKQVALHPWIGHPPSVSGTGGGHPRSVCEGFNDRDVVGRDLCNDLVFFQDGFELWIARTLQEVAPPRRCCDQVLVEAPACGRNKFLNITKAEVACHVSGNAPCGVGKSCHSRCQRLLGAWALGLDAVVSASCHGVDGR